MDGLRYIAVFSSQPRETLKLTRSLSPQVALHDSGAVLLTVSERYEEEALEGLLQGSVASGRLDYASAATQAAALFAARMRPGSRVSAEETAGFVARFPVELLSMYPWRDLSAHLDTLGRWGIRTLGQLAALPREELAARLGPDASRLQALASGEDVAPFQSQPEAERFQAGKELDWELDGLEPLAFALGDILEHLCSRLFQRGLATDRLEVVLRLADGSNYRRSIPLALPMRKPKTLLSLLLLKLQGDPPRAAIKRLSVEARPAALQTSQPSLLEPTGPRAEDLSRTMARLTALVGEENLGSPLVEDSHRPDPAGMRDFEVAASRRKHLDEDNSEKGRVGGGNRVQLVLRRIRPPRPFRLRSDQIVAYAGPWKSSGHWWRPPPLQDESESGAGVSGSRAWWRDEWDVQLSGGGVYRVFWDRLRKEWFLEGQYD